MPDFKRLNVGEIPEAADITDAVQSDIVDTAKLIIADSAGAKEVTIAVFMEYLRDAMAGFITAGSNVTITHDDADNTLTIAATDTNTDTNTQRTDEEIRDVIANFVTAGSGVTVTHDDAADTLTLGASFPETYLWVDSGGYSTLNTDESLDSGGFSDYNYLIFVGIDNFNRKFGGICAESVFDLSGDTWRIATDGGNVLVRYVNNTTFQLLAASTGYSLQSIRGV